jgi:hypothetical protein
MCNPTFRFSSETQVHRTVDNFDIPLSNSPLDKRLEQYVVKGAGRLT